MIHYHGTPATGIRTETERFLAGRHCLIPFPNPVDLPVAMDVCASFCVDNGAFTVWKQGGTLDVDGYKRFVEKVMRHPAFDFALIPDVVDGKEADNDRLIVQWPFGDRGVPVWHMHESLDRLRFLAGSWRTVAIGSSGRWPNPGRPDWWQRMAEAMDAIVVGDGQPLCRLHGLRMLSRDIFTLLPLASADSTNAVRNANLIGRFGSYPPPTLGQRQQSIANGIEAHQSAACWAGLPTQAELFAQDFGIAP